MSITIKPIVRTFLYNGITLADVPDLSAHEIRDLYSAQYPELVSAEIEAGEITGARQTFTFRKAVGTKGQTDKPVQHGPRLTALCERLQAIEAGAAGALPDLPRALSRRSTVACAAPWGRFADATLDQRRSAALQRASATSAMLTPLP